MNVLVYSGPETLQPSVSRTITALRSALYPQYTVQPVTLQSLTSHPWTASCALLVFPALREQLSLSSAVAASVRSYVEKGGALLGLRAGAKYGGSLFGSGEYSLRFQHAKTGASIYCNFAPGGEEGTQQVSVVTDEGITVPGIVETSTATFESVEGPDVAQVLARQAEDNSIVAAQFPVGAGHVALWSVHIEAPIVVDGEASAELREAEEQRRKVLGKTLASLGLQLPSPSGSEPAHPLPQFLVCSLSRPDIVSRIVDSLALKPPATFQDANDTFAFHDATEAEVLLQQSRSSTNPDNTRHVIIYSGGSLPPTTFTPLFNVQQYFEDLSAARSKAGRTAAEPWGVGEALFYGEAVTSTQTLLDK